MTQHAVSVGLQYIEQADISNVLWEVVKVKNDTVYVSNEFLGKKYMKFPVSDANIYISTGVWVTI